MAAVSANDADGPNDLVRANEPPQADEIEAVQSQDRTIVETSAQDETDNASQAGPFPADRMVTLLRGADGHYTLAEGTRLANNLSPAVGFMELANAGDFAANVWNKTPVPVFAIVLMAVGGTFAAAFSVLAFRDSKLAHQNVRLLREQWREQKAERARRLARGQSTRSIDVYLTVTFRELGSEVIARWCLDLLLGSCAVLIAIGTYMAIGGANPKVFLASNILSGYLGNAPMALYGLINAWWSFYIFVKAQGHIEVTRKRLEGSKAAALVKRRSRHVQVFCAINGTATILGGIGSMLTATRWWGYVILIPVIVSSLFCNIWWRRRVGYSRARVRAVNLPPLIPSELAEELAFASRAATLIQKHKLSPVEHLVAEATSLSEVLAFLEQYSLIDDFFLWLASTNGLPHALGSEHRSKLDISIFELLTGSASQVKLLEKVQKFIGAHGTKHFRERERYTAELLGTYYSIAGNAENVDCDGEEVKE